MQSCCWVPSPANHFKRAQLRRSLVRARELSLRWSLLSHVKGLIPWVIFFLPSDRTSQFFSSIILLIPLAKAQINGFVRHNIERE